MKIDLSDPALFANGHPVEAYHWLRENDPIHWNPEADGPGFWAVTRHADVAAVDHDWETYSSSPTIMLRDPLPNEPTFGDAKMMLMMDPPQHTAFRKLIRAEFTREASALRAPRLAALARQIIDAVIHDGECDFVAQIAGEMPSFVIAELMGLPLQDGRELYKLTELIHSDPASLPPNAAAEAVFKMFGYGQQVIAEKRARPADDLATRILNAEVDGKRITDPEFLLFFLLLIDAGGDTTRNLLSTGLWTLLNNKDQLDWLREDIPARLPRAREELLRLATPVIYMRRTATKDARIQEAHIKAGDKVVMYFAAANRDPAVFSDPDTLDLSRDASAHLAFGGGPHVCLGQHIARLEIDAMLAETLTRLDNIECIGEPEWLPSTFISGPKKMRVRYRPA